MTKQVISTGSSANDGTGDTLRQAGTKINANFTEIYNLVGDGTNLSSQVTIQDSAVVFEGNLADAHETFLMADSATADRTITLPNATGTVSLIGNAETLTNKTLTSPDINGGTIDGTVIGGSSPASIIGTTVRSTGNFDVNTNKFNVTASNGNTGIAGNLDVTGTVTSTGNFDVNTNKFTVNATNGNTASAGSISGTSVEVTGTTGSVKLPTLTTTQRNALSAANGMLVYNSTTSKIEAYAGGAWVQLH
tara:strand:+ start:321 stop:1067 length:747 start_codon:yes stop_codon:yes gene_type:complete